VTSSIPNSDSREDSQSHEAQNYDENYDSIEEENYVEHDISQEDDESYDSEKDDERYNSKEEEGKRIHVSYDSSDPDPKYQKGLAGEVQALSSVRERTPAGTSKEEHLGKQLAQKTQRLTPAEDLYKKGLG